MVIDIWITKNWPNKHEKKKKNKNKETGAIIRRILLVMGLLRNVTAASNYWNQAGPMYSVVLINNEA